VDEPENTVEAREGSMRLQLAGAPGAAATAGEAAAGLAEAQRELAGRRAGYGLGFGYVKNFGSPRGLDGIRLEFAITDGEGRERARDHQRHPALDAGLRPQR
jgi:hypothetical protein